MGFFNSCCPLEYQIHQKYPIFLYSIPISLFYDIYVCLISSRPLLKLRKNFVNFHAAYHSFFFVLFWLRIYLQDQTCSDNPNSVSGHTYFHTYFFINRLLDYITTHQKKSLFHTFLFMLSGALNFVNLSITYLGAYHTPKQMLYGAIFGLIVILIYRIASNNFLPRTMTKFYMAHLLVWLFIVLNLTSYKSDFQKTLVPSFIWIATIFVLSILDTVEVKHLN